MCKDLCQEHESVTTDKDDTSKIFDVDFDNVTFGEAECLTSSGSLCSAGTNHDFGSDIFDNDLNYFTTNFAECITPLVLSDSSKTNNDVPRKIINGDIGLFIVPSKDEVLL